MDIGKIKAEQLVKSGDIEGLKVWLAGGGDLRLRLDNDETLLHKAAFNGQAPMIGFLLDRGLPIDLTDRFGYMPLHEAARNAQGDAVKFLLSRGADAGARTAKGKSPADLAAEKGASQLVALLEQSQKKPQWVLSGEDEVVHIAYKHELGYSLTEIFNFGNETYLLIARNLETKAESSALKTFDELRGGPLLAAAEREFEKLGGKVPETESRLDKPKSCLKAAGPGDF